MTVQKESVVEDNAVCSWYLNGLLTESIPAGQQAVSLLEAQLWNHLDSPKGEGLLALRQAGAATALCVLATAMQQRQYDSLRVDEGADTKDRRQAVASMRRDTAQRVWKLLAARTAEETDSAGFSLSPAPLGNELLIFALWRLLAVAVCVDDALQSWRRGGSEITGGTDCSWVSEILQAAQRQLCPVEDQHDSKGEIVRDRHGFLRSLHKRAVMDVISQLLAVSESSAIATELLASTLSDGKANGSPSGVLPIQAALEQLASGNLNERNAERTSATKLLAQWNRLIRSRNLSDSANQVGFNAATASITGSVGSAATVGQAGTTDQAQSNATKSTEVDPQMSDESGESNESRESHKKTFQQAPCVAPVASPAKPWQEGTAGVASTSMLPGVAALQATVSVIIELGTVGILAQPHVDMLCDGIADLVAHSVTDWRVAGLVMKAVELVAVFSEDNQDHGRDCLPEGNASSGRKRQLGRQLVRLAGPELLK